MEDPVHFTQIFTFLLIFFFLQYVRRYVYLTSSQTHALNIGAEKNELVKMFTLPTEYISVPYVLQSNIELVKKLLSENCLLKNTQSKGYGISHKKTITNY